MALAVLCPQISNNLALAIQMAATAEAMAFGISLGLDPKTLAGIFNTSSARCWSSDSYNPVPVGHCASIVKHWNAIHAMVPMAVS